jgi:pimeloyl-ACP methyl ester carboxylesterase
MNQQSSLPYIVVGIDGTGSRQWRRQDGSNSSVYKFVRDFHYGSVGVDRRFFDGPSDVTRGLQSEPILQQALDFVYNRLRQLFPQINQRHLRPLSMFDVNACHQTNERARADIAAENGGYFLGTSTARVPVQVTTQMLTHQPLSTNQVRIVIVGHSRGGLVATVLARMLSPLVKVYFLGLYDAVDRQPCLDGMVVENVKYVFHARRHASVGSRSYFSNTSTTYRSDYHEEQFFYTSHGGIGGSFVPGERDNSWFADTSCIPQPATRTMVVSGVPVMMDNTHPLTRRMGKPIDQICADGGRSADAFIRGGARRFGLPIQ